MATEYVISGPSLEPGGLTKVSTTPAHALGARVETKELGSEKIRGYKYCKISAAFSAGVPVYISSVNDLLYAASSTAGLGQEIGVPQVAITSPTGSSYGFVQTHGYFDNTGEFAGVGIYAVSATVLNELFVSSTAGAVSTVPTGTMPVTVGGARALTNGSSANVYAFAPAPLKATRDAIA